MNTHTTDLYEHLDKQDFGAMVDFMWVRVRQLYESGGIEADVEAYADLCEALETLADQWGHPRT